MKKSKLKLPVLAWFLLLSAASVNAGNAEHPNDTHYTASGFFDIHVCNWPDRPPFYMALYSTYQFNEVKSVEMLDAKGEKFAELDLSKFRIINADNKPEKRVFMNQIPQPANYTDGWFSAKVTLNDGTVHVAKDFVQHGLLPMAANLQPAQGELLDDIPETLSWPAVKGAKHYQVFIKDKWDFNKVIFTSDVLDRPEVQLPEELLEYGGYYSWRVHARDVNGDVRFGDFNQGSLSEWQELTIAN